MRKFLICAGVHGRPRSLEWMRQVVEKYQPDGILFAGGVLDRVRQYAAKTTPWGLTREDGLFVEQFFEAVGKLGVWTAIIPGPMDTPLDDFLRLGMHAEIENPAIHMAHATVQEKEDVAVCGMGGCIAEGEAIEIDTCSRIMAEYHLRPLWTSRKPHKVLLLPTAPPGPLGERDACTLTGDLIDTYHPNLCVVGGISERQGVQRIAHTMIVNPGYLSDGLVAYLDWHRPVADQIEFLNLHHPDWKAEPAETGVCD